MGAGSGGPGGFHSSVVVHASARPVNYMEKCELIDDALIGVAHNIGEALPVAWSRISAWILRFFADDTF